VQRLVVASRPVCALKERQNFCRVCNAGIYSMAVPDVAHLATFWSPLRGYRRFQNSLSTSIKTVCDADRLRYNQGFNRQGRNKMHFIKYHILELSRVFDESKLIRKQ